MRTVLLWMRSTTSSTAGSMSLPRGRAPSEAVACAQGESQEPRGVGGQHPRNGLQPLARRLQHGRWVGFEIQSPPLTDPCLCPRLQRAAPFAERSGALLSPCAKLLRRLRPDDVAKRAVGGRAAADGPGKPSARSHRCAGALHSAGHDVSSDQALWDNRKHLGMGVCMGRGTAPPACDSMRGAERHCPAASMNAGLYQGACTATESMRL